MSQQRNHCYEFGPFRLDVAERLLRRDGFTATGERIGTLPITKQDFGFA